MIRVIVREVQTLMPHGEPLIKHKTFELDAPAELESLLLVGAATVIGAEYVPDDESEQQ